METEGNPVVAARQALKWSQRKLGREARISPREIRKAERDEPVSWPITTAIAYAIKQDAEQLEAKLISRRQAKLKRTGKG